MNTLEKAVFLSGLTATILFLVAVTVFLKQMGVS